MEGVKGDMDDDPNTAPVTSQASASSAPSASMSEASKRSGHTAAPHKKPNSDARKAQNRISSQKYRRRRKQRLSLLKQLLDPSETTESQNLTSNNEIFAGSNSRTSTPTTDSGTGVPQNEVVPDSATTFADDGYASFQACDKDLVQDLEYSTAREMPVDSGIGPFLSYTPSSGLSNSTFPSSISEPLVPVFGATAPFIYTDMQERQQSRPITDMYLMGYPTIDPMSTVLENIQHLTLSQKHQVSCLLEIETEMEASQAKSMQTVQHSPFSSNDIIDSYKSPQSVLIKMKKEVRGFEARLKKALSYRSSLPDPKINVIRVINSNFYAAILANSEAIGLFDFEVLKEDGLSPFSVDHENGYPQDQLDIVRGRFTARMPPSLAPCDAQLKHPHHPYLDVIPFREFRERAVAALSCDPPLFSEEMMCNDMDAEGLVCWGGAAADGEDKVRRGMEMEVPWDPRSWEPKEWFLQKYWFLVGGEDGEMHASARIWSQRRLEESILVSG